MASKIKIYDICWHTGGEDTESLPEEIIIDDLPEEDVKNFYEDNDDASGAIAIQNWLYDHYGFGAECFGGEVILEDTL